MKTLDREQVRSVVNTIVSQLLHTTPIDIINSWGILKMYATQIVKIRQHAGAERFFVCRA